MQPRYCIRRIIGESNIWRFALKMQLARFLIGGFEYCMERNPCLQPNGVQLVWRYLRNLPNCQIKTTAKYTPHIWYFQIYNYEGFANLVTYISNYKLAPHLCLSSLLIGSKALRSQIQSNVPNTSLQWYNITH